MSSHRAFRYEATSSQSVVSVVAATFGDVAVNMLVCAQHRAGSCGMVRHFRYLISFRLRQTSSYHLLVRIVPLCPYHLSRWKPVAVLSAI